MNDYGTATEIVPNSLKPGGTITVADTTYRIISTHAVVSGERVAYWKVQLRK